MLLLRMFKILRRDKIPSELGGLSHFGPPGWHPTRESQCESGPVTIVHELYLFEYVLVCHLHVSRTYWCSDQTENCKEYKNKTIKCPGSSNFISHSSKCKSIPLELRWEAYKAQNGAEIGTGKRDAGASGVAGSTNASGLEAQHVLIDHFSAQGLQNPAKSVTSKGFREHLVKGLIEDDLPYTLGKKPGMRKLFNYLLPCGIPCPSHQTIRWDLNTLYKKVNQKVNHMLQMCNWYACYCTYTLADNTLFSQMSQKSQSPATFGQARIWFTHLWEWLHSGLI